MVSQQLIIQCAVTYAVLLYMEFLYHFKSSFK